VSAINTIGPTIERLPVRELAGGAMSIEFDAPQRGLYQFTVLADGRELLRAKHFEFALLQCADHLLDAVAEAVHFLVKAVELAYAITGQSQPPLQVRLNVFDGRPVYRYRTADGEAVVYADTGALQVDGVPPALIERVASRWVGQPVAAATCAGSFGFAPMNDYTSGLHPYSLAVSDLNGDGRNDIAVANDSGNDVSVLLASGSPGSFAPPVHYPTGNRAGSVVASDLNGDGRPDLAVTNLNSNTLSVLLAAGSPGSCFTRSFRRRRRWLARASSHVTQSIAVRRIFATLRLSVPGAVPSTSRRTPTPK